MLDSSVIEGNSISVHVQANDVGGVDMGAFSSPSTETGMTQSWYESQIQGCFVKASDADQGNARDNCCEKIRATLCKKALITLFKRAVFGLLLR